MTKKTVANKPPIENNKGEHPTRSSKTKINLPTFNKRINFVIFKNLKIRVNFKVDGDIPCISPVVLYVSTCSSSAKGRTEIMSGMNQPNK